MKNVIMREHCKLACGLLNVNILSKVNKFNVLLYLKKSNLDNQGKAPIMGRITLNRSNLFACKSKNSMDKYLFARYYELVQMMRYVIDYAREYLEKYAEKGDNNIRM